MNISFSRASTLDFHTLAQTFNNAFRGYIAGSPQFSASTFSSFLLINMVDCNLSKIMIDGDTIKGIGLVSRFNNQSRLAGMGVYPELTGIGIGKRIVDLLVKEAMSRKDIKLVLEVIQQNIRAVSLYKKAGFKTIRTLHGYIYDQNNTSSKNSIKPSNISRFISALANITTLNLPWQMSLPNLSVCCHPDKVFRYKNAYAVISDPSNEVISLKSAISEKGFNGAGRIKILIEGLFSRYPQKKWNVPPYYPEEYDPIFLELGFKKRSLSQIQMELPL